MAEMVKKFDVHANKITERKKQLLNGAADVFGKGAKTAEDAEDTVQALHAKIGQLTMENDLLERIHGPPVQPLGGRLGHVGAYESRLSL